ncbi:endonuclease/exonuclease/phosphatase family protein [Nocardioides bruguierae]|uniref:endonuclease/exonuclease/phosphatase family protein n=1 Tax=Nocardioides bruguierae TaxID=2945102 RepID=UPI00201FF2EC|nr:endonuclease/exonuclease/phosphatase family protein [Nocardioides bruguierae]MCL8026502.1 endonuclease/exonuclease/phosphatase family protein [Nocardioides bruguierae]
MPLTKRAPAPPQPGPGVLVRVGRVVLWTVLLALLVPALLLTWLRLSDAEGDLAVRAVAFTPFAFVAYLFVLVLAAGAWWARRRAVHRLLVALVAAVGVLVHGSWLLPLVVGPPDRAADAERHLVVLSANALMGQADPDALMSVADEEAADLVVLPEATVGLVAGLDAAGAAGEYPYRVGTAAEEGSTAGTVVLSRFPLGEPTRVGTIMESWAVDVDVPDEPGGAGGDAGDSVRLLAVHPAAPADPDSFRADAAVLRAAVREEAPDLVVGDFNATLDHVQLRRLLSAGLRDAAEEAGSGWQPTWPANGLFAGLPFPLVSIDHVLVGPGLTASSTRTHLLAGTDHLALVADLGLAG